MKELGRIVGINLLIFLCGSIVIYLANSPTRSEIAVNLGGFVGLLVLVLVVISVSRLIQGKAQKAVFYLLASIVVAIIGLSCCFTGLESFESR